MPNSSLPEQGQHACSCCDRTYARRALHKLDAKPPAYLCRRCGLWIALRLRRDHVEA